MKRKPFHTIKLLINGESITEFNEIFEHAPKTRVRQEAGIGSKRINSIIEKAGRMTFDEMSLLSHIFEVEEEKVIHLIQNQRKKNKKLPARKK